METLKKILYFAQLCAFAVGFLGGCGYCIVCGAYFVAACILALAAMALPSVVNAYKNLTK